MKKLLLTLLLSTVITVCQAASSYIIIPVQSAKLGGGYITTNAVIDGANGAWRVLFDDSTDEEIIYIFQVPDDFDSGLTIELTYTMDNETADEVIMFVEVMANADGEDVDSASFDSANTSGAITVPGTTGLQDTITITLSNDDSIAAGEVCILRITRDADNAGDDADNDLELRTITVSYTNTN